MTEKAEQKPFWVSKEEYQGLQTTPVDHDLSASVAEGVPDLTEVDGTKVVGKYGYKDGILIYHFYHRMRKEIIDAAEAELELIRDDCDVRLRNTQDSQARQAIIADKDDRQARVSGIANEGLSEIPWWPDFEESLTALFPEVFKYQKFKVTFYPEVDSWSVILPAGTTPMAPSKEQLELPFKHLNLALANVG